MLTKKFHIYGDNIVECERTLFLIRDSLGKEKTKLTGPLKSAVCPDFCIDFNNNSYLFTLFPGFGRWDQDILDSIRSRGGLLREATDTIITKIEGNLEIPILCIEYCSALPAGNQAWQRNGRAYSFPRAGIPFLYMAEIGGFELNSSRERKAARLPNPAVPFSYVSYSFYAPAPVIPVYTANAGADQRTTENYDSVLGEQLAQELITSLIEGVNYSDTLESIQEKVIKLVSMLADSRKPGSSLSPKQWQNAKGALKEGKNLLNYLEEIKPISWSKTAYIEGLTSTAKQTMEAAKRFGQGLTSSNLPFCFFTDENRLLFHKALLDIYPDLSDNFNQWMRRNKTLIICWIMGFKPKGDDARPDRGLLPMVRMLVGEDVDILSFIYGPAKALMWKQLHNDPSTLIEKNGLWEAVLLLSNAVLIDSMTDKNLTEKGYIKTHWKNYKASTRKHIGVTHTVPIGFGEHDVDTAIHLLFRFQLNKFTFEGMCNPPGGDWSGVSILNKERSVEYRWLSLPRVSQSGSKRPDHIIQIFGCDNIPIILCIESKDYAKNLEKEIGHRLTTYAKDLFGTLPNAYRPAGSGENWLHFNSRFSKPAVHYISAVAFLAKSPQEIEKSAQICNSDLVIGVEIEKTGTATATNIKIYAVTERGREVKDFILKNTEKDIIKLDSLQ